MKTRNFLPVMLIAIVACGTEDVPSQNTCEPNPCNGHGSCSADGQQALCTCVGEWSGALCTIPPPTCADVICPDNGDCFEISGSPMCLCNDGYIGGNCDECDDQQGYHLSSDNATCTTDLCDPNTCSESNKTVCESDGVTQTCSCDSGYHNESGSCVTDGLCWNVNCPDDGNVCNGTEQCNTGSGQCESVNPLVCGNSDVCDGIETCNAVTGCQNGTPLTCGNNDVCDGLETCDSINGCQNGTPVNCSDDGNACNGNEACDPTDGQCKSFNPVVCNNDGNVCNGTEQCNTGSGQCESVNPLVCGNNDVCDGLETCDSINGCQAGTALTCNDGLICNGVESCDPSTGCTDPANVDCGSNGNCVETPVAGACECTGNWDPDTNCADCLTGWDSATSCTTCATGYHDESSTCVVNEVCDINSCNSHGTCDDSNGIVVCACTGGWTGDYCDVVPTPTVNNVVVDCSSTAPWCFAGGFDTYPVNFDVTNATSCTGSAETIVGSGTPGTVNNCVVNGATGTCDYTTGSSGSNTIQITIECTGPSGTGNNTGTVVLD